MSSVGNRLFITGASSHKSDANNNFQYYDIATISYNATTGNNLWTKRFNGTADKHDWGLGVTTSPDGQKAFVVGKSNRTATELDVVTISYWATNGTQQWVSYYDGPASAKRNDVGYLVATNNTTSASDLRLYVVGTETSASGDADIVVLAYNPSSGALLWSQSIDGPGGGSDDATSIALNPGGTRLYLSGRLSTATRSGDYALIALRTSDGSVLWQNLTDGSSHESDLAQHAVVDPDGTMVYASGYTRNSGTGMDATVTAHYASNGTRAWKHTINGAANLGDVFFQSAVSNDGNYLYSVGWWYTSTTNKNDLLVEKRATSSGTQSWQATFNRGVTCLGTQTACGDYATGIVLSPDAGTVYVSASTQTSATNFFDYTLFSYDAGTGARNWVKFYNGPSFADDQALAIARSPDGTSIYITGESTGLQTNYDYATIRYRASDGELMWVVRYDYANGNEFIDGANVSCLAEGTC